MPKRLSIDQTEIDKVPLAPWYQYTLECGHNYLSKKRIVVPVDKSFQEHYVRCTKCEDKPTAWTPITGMRARSNEFVSHVRSGDAFLLPNRIMRSHNFNPFPYASGSKDRDY